MSPAFDHAGSLKRFGNDERLFGEMVGFFFDDAPQYLSNLQAAIAANDVLKIQRAAHTLKGMVANFGAARAVAAAAQIEQHLSMGNISAVARAMPLLEDAIEELEQALSAYRLDDAAVKPAPLDSAKRSASAQHD